MRKPVVKELSYFEHLLVFAVRFILFCLIFWGVIVSIKLVLGVLGVI